MGRHKEWRKIAKKMRRKRIRKKIAELRDALEYEEEEKKKLSPGYAVRLAEEAAREAEAEEEERWKHEEEERRWLEEERRVQEEHSLRQALLKELEEAKEKKRIEQENESRRKKEAEKERQEKMADYIYQFALGKRCSLPAEMLVPSETQPGKEICPFFNKVAACRFWDTCSRNHVRPALSDILLFPGFYSHFTMSRIGHAEYDTDMSLEYDDKETYAHFLEFYRDIRYEFEACGRLTQIVVCSNPEPHLRGNVYVSYASEKEAMAAYLKFNGRYYAGKQLSCQFVTIPSWRSAICGLHFRKKCPKGNNCNFLHVYKDPGPPFYEPHNRRSPDTWRWSVSPERENERKDDDLNGSSSERRKRKHDNRNQSHEDPRSSPKARKKNNRSREKRDRSRERRESTRERLERSSERKERSCRKRGRSSERRERSSERRERSNERRDGSSERREQSNERTERSSERRGLSSERREWSSDKRSRSAERNSDSKRSSSKAKNRLRERTRTRERRSKSRDSSSQ